MQHYYYLHENGELIHKTVTGGSQAADFRESDLVKMFWILDTGSRFDAWRILVEAKALGANEERVSELATKWGCGDDDAQHFGSELGLNLTMDGNSHCATCADFVNLQESPAGFGGTYLEAISELLRAVGFRPSKTWGATVRDALGTTQ